MGAKPHLAGVGRDFSLKKCAFPVSRSSAGSEAAEGRGGAERGVELHGVRNLKSSSFSSTPVVDLGTEGDVGI